MTLFRATAADVPRIEWCAKLCCAEHGEQRVAGGLNWPHYREFLTQVMDSGRGFIYLAADDDGMIVGGMAGEHIQPALTGKRRANQLFIYVKPELRGRVSVRRMVGEFECWAREQQCFDICLPLLDTMPAKSEAFYRRMGYLPSQTMFVKRLELP